METPQRRPSCLGSIARFVGGVLAWGALFVIGMIIVILVTPWLLPVAEAPARASEPPRIERPQVQPPIAPPVPRSTLPSCSQVTDTTTACIQDSAEQGAQSAEQPDALRSPLDRSTLVTPTPPYMAACWTAVGERPCWLPVDAPWSPPASIPETPIVLLPDPPLVDVCATWHAPKPYPEACNE